MARKLRKSPPRRLRPADSSRLLPSWPLVLPMFCICCLLAAAVAVAFLPALRMPFLHFDDDIYVWGEPHVTNRLDRAKLDLGLDADPRRQLAPTDDALAHAGLRDLRPPARGPSPGQSGAARAGRDARIPRLRANDRPVLGLRRSGRHFCRPSAAGRIGGLGGRAQGPALRGLLLADASGLRPLRPIAVFGGPLCTRGFLLRPGASFQTDGGQPAAGDAGAGLLAAS